jgi:EAL domain-containing protein (putative c-di-GMP-specific phosphodiesterase class I)
VKPQEISAKAETGPEELWHGGVRETIDGIALMAVETNQGDPIPVGRVLNQRLVHTFFQPLVHLADGEVVGFEALSRGPEDTDLENPLALFEAAKNAGRLEELDWLCASSAFEAAHRAKLHPSMTIFLNFKPGTLTSPYPEDLAKDIIRARKQSRVVAEIDEEDLRNEPALVLEAASRARADGWGIALDNVGATPASLALLPILHPDVVKLDLRVLGRHRGQEAAEIEMTVRTYAEMSGAAILAQRVETESDVHDARGFGATYGEGWHYGRPDVLPPGERMPRAAFPFLRTVEDDASATPFEVVHQQRASTTTDKQALARISSVLEHRALSNGAPFVLLACIQDGGLLTRDARIHYEGLARQAAFTAVFGTDMGTVRLPEAQVVDVPVRHALAKEWNVIVVGPSYTGALLAQDLGDVGDTRYRRYEHIVTHDRDLVVEAARSLLRWIDRRQGE